MIFYVSLIFLLLSAVNAVKTYEDSDLDKAKIEEYYLCLDTLLCYEKQLKRYVEEDMESESYNIDSDAGEDNAKKEDYEPKRLKEIDEFRKLGETVKGKECEGYFRDALIAGYDATPELTFGYWEDLGKRVCAENRDKWVDRFKDFGRSMGGSFQANNCESQKEHPMCQCFFCLFEEGEAVIKNYTDMGICGNPKREFKKINSFG